jgi:NAD(P) transhydrogenase subunit alpha
VTRADEMITVNGVHVMAPTNLPSLVASDASRFFSSNIRALLNYLLEGSSRLRLDPSDPIIGAMLAGRSTASSSAAA